MTMSLTMNFVSSNVFAADLGMLPPDLDYQTLCVKKEIKQVKEFDWSKHSPATSGLSDVDLAELAESYYHGTLAIAPDYDRARAIVEYLLTKTDSIRYLALDLQFQMYRDGRGYPQNPALAKEAIMKLVEAGLPQAFSYYGSMYEAEGDYALAAENYRQAFVRGHSRGAINLALLYHDKKIPATDDEIGNYIKRAFDSLLKDLNKGRCESLTSIGAMYDRLDNIPKAEYYSSKWLEKSAVLNDAYAKIKLAQIIQRGYVLPYDEAKIMKLWTEAADLGNETAMFRLGEHYFLNYKNDEDLKAAASWLEKAADRRSVKAMEMLAILYSEKYPAVADSVKQLRWLETAAQYSEADADTIMLLADRYRKDKSIPREKIFNLHQVAADKGNYKAYVNLGDAFQYGVGAELSPVKALRYYRVAASNADTSAMEALKKAYECGIGVEKDLIKASFWGSEIAYYNNVAIIDRAYKFLQLSDADEASTKQMSEDLRLLAITKDNVEAKVLLSLLYEKQGNAVEAMSWQKKAIDEDIRKDNDFPGHALLGKLTLEGRLRRQNAKEGLSFLEKATAAGNSGSYSDLGSWYMEQGDLSNAEKNYLEASGRGEVSAFSKLAKIKILQNNYPAAIAYFEHAADYHDTNAMLKLAEGYEEKGWIKAPDVAKSHAWFDRALKSYPCKASDIVSISNAYKNGRFGLEKDDAVANNWLALIKDLEPTKDNDAFNLAKAILSSEMASNPESRQKALTVLERLAAKGDADSSSLLTGIYLDRSNPGYDADKALSWITRSAENGDVKSMLELANMYMSGYGVTASVGTARSWLEKASALGNAEASQRLKDLKVSP